MTATCPACATAERTVLIAAALREPDGPEDPATRTLLDVPREPKSLSVASNIMFVLAVLTSLPVVIALVSLFRAQSKDEVVHLLAGAGPIALLAGAFATTGWGLLRAARNRRRAEGGWPVTYDQWVLVHGVWRAAWLCRGCRVAFFPAGSLRADFPASPPLQLVHFQDWLTETARQTELAGGLTAAPATSAPTT